ncbi:MAG: cofactor-independent phosphoglycerate mutase [Clostridiales bacterium]|nr:cofactor-independent phosphoglycerate mutase [Clostridiales bacterium]
MKYVVILGDGMADYRQPSLGGKTPLMLANKPYIDQLAKQSELGLCKTVPCGMKPGSDVANLSVLGYNPKECYTGRSPLEAASIGIALDETDVTARANLVTVSNEENYVDKTMVDYSAGEISTAEAKELIEFLAKELDNEDYKLYAGISYRHCLVMKNGVIAGDLTPPHDITGKPVKEHLPKSEQGKKLLSIMERSYALLKDHPVNLKRIAQGKNPANSLWFWGEGTKPNMQSFKDKFGLNGAIISAVDLLKGIGKLTGMQVIEVEGATGNYDTNFVGKADACLDALKNGADFVYVHMEAPDECGHHGDAKNKIYSIEQIDEKVVKKVVEGLKATGEDFAVLIAPDHPTPISIMTHCSDPVPYLIYKSNRAYPSTATAYTEEQAESTGNFVDKGYQLIEKLIKN